MYQTPHTMTANCHGVFIAQINFHLVSFQVESNDSNWL